ncbi:hypothetical protein F406_gp077 [Agrobacterium phage 7-7-1]|uniref:Uncharacterized protein n=1 Tax=Agrobacterium phage 7-7-1 TaxID=1161931 RepID=J7FAQ8_9CAUD|nr:hypothetical protein F406_gp077 [Agrobacterium phage 7-7-1]AFH19738.1 hypothetical protein 7-7-1_00040 [Agrobacterium phage 7-7-1]
MISTRVEKAEVIAKLIPIIDELVTWEKEHREDRNPGRFNLANRIRFTIFENTRFAARLFRLCEFRGDSFITIDLESVDAYRSLTLERVRAEFAAYDNARAEFVERPVPVKPAVTYDDNQRAHDAVLCSLIIVTISLIAAFA